MSARRTLTGRLRARAGSTVTAARARVGRLVEGSSGGSAGTPPALPARRAVRSDPVPELRPLPDVMHIVLVGQVPVDYGGRTASILTKCKTLYELGGIRSMILTTSRSAYLPEALEAMRRRGHLSEGVEIRNIADFYPDDSTAPDGQGRDSDGPEGWTRLRDGDPKRSLYFNADGVHNLRREFGPDGSVIADNWLTDGRVRQSREEFAPDGRLVRRTFYDTRTDTRRQDVYYRRDGSPMFSHWTAPPVNPGGWLRDDRVVFFDAEGRPEETAPTIAPMIHRCLDAVIGDRPAVVSVEARFVDRVSFAYERPNVRCVYVLHSSHLEPPGDDPRDIRRTFRALFERVDRVPAVVFLTDSQRAEAEERLGRHDNLVVIPHSSPTPRLDPTIGRDPHLVVMVGRLSKEKRFDHGIRAFAEVLKQHPDARLEIYGDGPEKKALQAEISRAGVGGSVRLMGFTNDPGAVYQRASACLLTSSFEGAPLVLVEALRHRCPVVAYDIRYGPADIIEDGVNGFLVRPGDRSALARRVSEVLGDADLRDRLVAGAARAEERFGPEAFVARWSQLFHRLADDIASSRAADRTP